VEVGYIDGLTEEHTAPIIRAEVRSVVKWMVYIGIGDGSDHGEVASQSHGLRKGDGAMSRKEPF
jgi:hypothetical protein